MFSHGTLLFDSDIDSVVDALNVKPGKIESKGLKSIRSRVANISEFLEHPMSIEAFRESLLHSVFEGETTIPRLTLTEDDWNAVNALAESKYRRWEWNYGRSPRFNVRRIHRFPFGEMDVRLDIEKGVIVDFHLYGDFFSLQDVERIEEAFVGAAYEGGALRTIMDGLDLPAFFPDLDKEMFLEFIL
jgi:lipoate-protein ligase A